MATVKNGCAASRTALCAVRRAVRRAVRAVRRAVRRHVRRTVLLNV